MAKTGKVLVNLRPSTGLCTCGSDKVKRFGFPSAPSTDESGKKKSARTNCIDCKQPGMVNLSLSKKPEEAWGGKCNCGSNKARRFGLKDGKRTHCIQCKTEEMVNLTTKLCACGSERQVRFGDPGGKATKCSQCKTDGMVDLTKKKMSEGGMISTDDEGIPATAGTDGGASAAKGAKKASPPAETLPAAPPVAPLGAPAPAPVLNVAPVGDPPAPPVAPTANAAALNTLGKADSVAV